MSQFNETLNKKAVALKYDEDQMAAPVIIASGMGHMAEKIIEVANESGIPVYEDNSLATVLSQLDLGTEIPEELYKAVVDIYAFFLKYTEKQKAVPNSDDTTEIQEGTETEEKEEQEV